MCLHLAASATTRAYLTTVIPMDLAVPMTEVQMDSRGTNSLPGSDCFTCADVRTRIAMCATALARAFAIS